MIHLLSSQTEDDQVSVRSHPFPLQFHGGIWNHDAFTKPEIVCRQFQEFLRRPHAAPQNESNKS